MFRPLFPVTIRAPHLICHQRVVETRVWETSDPCRDLTRGRSNSTPPPNPPPWRLWFRASSPWARFTSCGADPPAAQPDREPLGTPDPRRKVLPDGAASRGAGRDGVTNHGCWMPRRTVTLLTVLRRHLLARLLPSAL